MLTGYYEMFDDEQDNEYTVVLLRNDEHYKVDRKIFKSCFERQD